MPSRAGCTWCGLGGCTGVGIPGWVWEGNTGYTPTSLKAEGYDSGAGPGSPSGAGVGGHTLQRPLSYVPPLRDPVAYGLPVHASAPRDAASWPIRARFDLFPEKLSQNRVVSLKYVQKAYHSPYFQNGYQKSPLDFLGFPILPAFSPKELMGHFDR